MKKNVLIIGLVALVALVGCGRKGNFEQDDLIVKGEPSSPSEVRPKGDFLLDALIK